MKYRDQMLLAYVFLATFVAGVFLVGWIHPDDPGPYVLVFGFLLAGLIIAYDAQSTMKRLIKDENRRRLLLEDIENLRDRGLL